MIMQTFLVLLISLHGLINLIGCTKIFAPGKINRPALKSNLALSNSCISFLGILFLLTAILFIVTAISNIQDKQNWWIAGFAAVILSQFIIIIYWKDAKAGSIVNMVLLMSFIAGFFESGFHKETEKIKTKLAGTVTVSVNGSLPDSNLAQYPTPVKKWLLHSGVMIRPMIRQVTIKQQGEMLTKPGGKWMPFQADQFFTLSPPAFIWEARIKLLPGILIHARDVFEFGKGRMLIKPMAMIKVADTQGKETDQGTLLRYLAETCWFPSTALAPYISWESINDSSAKATMKYGETNASGTFTFNGRGDPIRFEALRYYENKGKFSLEKWRVDMSQHMVKNGIRIPIRAEVSWELNAAYFKWLKLELTDITYGFQ